MDESWWGGDEMKVCRWEKGLERGGTAVRQELQGAVMSDQRIAAGVPLIAFMAPSPAGEG